MAILSLGEAESGGSLGLTALAAQHSWEALGLFSENKVDSSCGIVSKVGNLVFIGVILTPTHINMNIYIGIALNLLN